MNHRRSRASSSQEGRGTNGGVLEEDHIVYPFFPFSCQERLVSRSVKIRMVSFIYPSRYFVLPPPRKLRETGPGSGEAVDIGKPIESTIPLYSMVDANQWFNLV